MSNQTGNQTGNTPKFVIFSIIGALMFLAPIPGDGVFNIPLGIVINWLNDFFRMFSFGEYNGGDFVLHYMLALIVISISFICTVITWLFKPKFIMDNEMLKDVFLASPVYVVSRALGFAFAWIVFLQPTGFGLENIHSAWTGDVIMGLAAGLVTIFIILGPIMPLLTDFGLMEFMGVLIKKVTRILFTLPGRASVDLMASWFGSSAAAVMITRNQLDKGFYTRRESAIQATCLSMVSLPFTLVVFNTLDIEGGSFWAFYGVMAITIIILAIIMPRIWPLRSLPDTYLESVGKQIHEDDDENVQGGMFSRAVEAGSIRAANTNFGEIGRSAIKSYVTIFMDLIPVIMAWGTIGILIAELGLFNVDVFGLISQPMGYYLNILGVEGAFDFAHISLIGFVDMFLPALLLGAAVPETKFILGVLSIVQIIYLAETGALILKSKIPLGIGKLAAVFLIRTIIGLPIIVALTALMF